MHGNSTLTEADKQNVERLWNDGYPRDYIGGMVGVSASRIGQLTVGPSPASLKTRIMRYIQVTDIQNLDSLRLARGLLTEGHQVQHILYELEKQNLVEFKEQQVGKRKRLYSIKPTNKGMDWNNGHEEPMPEIPPRLQNVPPSERWSGDQKLLQGYMKIEQNEGTFVIDKEPKTEEETVNTLAADIPEIPEVQKGGDFPLIKKLLQRERVIKGAALLLESVDKDDLALAVLAEADKYTPLEKEVLELLATVPTLKEKV